MAAFTDFATTQARRASAALDRIAKPFVVALGVAFLALIASVEEASGSRAALSLLYVFPIALVTWYVGGAWGVIFAVFGGVAAFAYGDLPHIGQLGRFATAWLLIARIGSFAFVGGLIFALKRAMDNQRNLANTDYLTQVANARAFRAAAAVEIARAERARTPLTAVYLDCDNFKTVNDKWGHAGGDRLLRTIAQALAANIRATDTAARMGGDEFALLLPDAGPDDARAVVEKLRAILLEAMAARRWPVTFSIGVVTYAHAPATVEDLLAKVDTLQYRAKTGGKDRVEFEAIGYPEPTTLAA
jgi:diguanylate cyclase (GGDEF)-like protein